MANTDDTQRNLPTPPDRDHSLRTGRQSAVNVIRGDIDMIYEGGETADQQAKKEIAEQTYTQQARQPETADQQATVVHQKVQEQWKQYHTSWQSYYQQYYERYYLNHLHKQNTHIAPDNQPNPDGVIASSEEDKVVNELRDKLLGTVKERSQKARKSRHFAPIFTACMFAIVFLFLQYNRFLFATVQAYVSPGNIDPQNVIVDQVGNMKVGPEPKLIIPKINVDTPIVYGTNVLDEPTVQNDLKKGVVHYPIPNASSAPGQNGATVILGHSSNDVFDSGAYKFVFVQLSKLEVGDSFYAHHEGTRYTYSVTKKEIIDPTEINKVVGDPTKPSMILITCDPPGTALKRLVIFADQVSPDPAKSTKAPSTTNKTPNKQISGNSPTFIERLFGDQ